MTSEIGDRKTNEFLRRRKLRLQQVREQSKDIAKKLRQRANVERLRQATDIDNKKHKEYLLQQEKLVERLEQLYAKGIDNVGAGHKNAFELQQKDIVSRIDLSKLRGKEAAAELKKQKQDKLDQQKKLLDRKLLAREAANDISREKSSTIVNKLQVKSTNNKSLEEAQIAKTTDNNANHIENFNSNLDKEEQEVERHDMATQWDFEPLPSEWEPTVPKLPLSKDDSAKESINNAENKSDKNKKLDLFALSEEMPSSLRGGLTKIPEERATVRPSLTLVSEFLQNRDLRLRESDTPSISKKTSEDLSSLKQTILRTRTSKPEAKSKNIGRMPTSCIPDSTLSKKESVMVYNHSTRDTRDIPHSDKRFVVRDMHTDEDAYSQAVKETTSETNNDKKNQTKLQNIRNKVAMTKQNIEKEYKDTVNFLNSLPKENRNKPVKFSYMDEQRQQMRNESHQRKMQHEFKKIEKESRKHSCCSNKSPNKYKSPAKKMLESDFDSRDFQYSWMPVPESDGSLAIHTIPTTVREGKSSNTVKFSKVDSYHEYRSRHKHTPPTKDIGFDKQANNHTVNNTDDSSTSSTSDTSSVENLELDNRSSRRKHGKSEGHKLSDTERIIIYKILDSKSQKQKKKDKNLAKDIAKSLNCIEKIQGSLSDPENKESTNKTKKSTTDLSKVSLDQLQEGVYKSVNEKGDNITSMYFSDNPREGEKLNITEEEIRLGRPCLCKKHSHQHDKVSTTCNKYWDSGDNPSGSRSIKSCIDCKCPCAFETKQPANDPAVMQPSAATSTTSFKTATNDKANNALPDGGFIKLVDDDGQETGKFYIGATGFLKDDAYEVVIQLRKKDNKNVCDENQENRSIVKQAAASVNPTAETSETVILPTSSDKAFENVQKIPNTEIHEFLTPRSPKFESNRTSPQKSTEFCEPISNIDVGETNGGKKQSQTANYIDKAVHTPFQMSYAIASHVPKSDSMQRPATSTYTQTTPSSPIQRPVYFHMSSSTSTAYMSPPEMILPKFLRRNAIDDDDYNRSEDIDLNDIQTENQDCCSKSKCKNYECRKKYKNLETPPNTASSSKEHAHKISTKISKCKCNKKEHRLQHICSKGKTKTITIPYKPPSRHFVMRAAPSINPSYKEKITSNCVKKSSGKSNFNPTIKKYVNKLLDLNKEGLRAIEVADQECSSVATPESSVINISSNISNRKPKLENIISLEDIKSILKQQILEEFVKHEENKIKKSQQVINNKDKPSKRICVTRGFKRKQVHKVKSLNISKSLLKTKTPSKLVFKKGISSSPSNKDEKNNTSMNTLTKTKPRSKSSPTPRSNLDIKGKKNTSESSPTRFLKDVNFEKCNSNFMENKKSGSKKCESKFFNCNKATISPPTPHSEIKKMSHQQKEDIPANIATQTSRNIETDLNFIKLAEGKLQNMEKIADLTEKCTKRLSNLAKVLEEVRKNKSLAYSQISTSDTASESDHKSDKNLTRSENQVNDIGNELEKSPRTIAPVEQTKDSNNGKYVSTNTDYVPFLKDIPKPLTSNQIINPSSNLTEELHLFSPTDLEQAKNRAKPPPALSRISLKHCQELVVPHELSTVMEVDSPMSVKLKHQSSRNDTKYEGLDNSNKTREETVKHNIDKQNGIPIQPDEEQSKNPDIRSNIELQSQLLKISESTDDSKMQMMDLNQFNEIMLKPFLTLQEYAKQRNVTELNEVTNLDELPKEVGKDDMSSLHSDGSLPDVIAELLKRNIISEPFKFDTASNVNSTTVSSESTLSVLALSKMKKDKKKSNSVVQNKENMTETSDTLSISSNPDLEIAFKKLGMGWASSTLKKTKERLALSSSSNTSSSSLSQFKIKSLNNANIPALVTDSVSSVLHLPKKAGQARNPNDNSKDAEQQTSLTNSMTVKEFLTNELSKKITFTNKSNRSKTKEEFVSLYETKMPEEMKHSSQMIREERSVDSISAENNNRARTSTPVQLFKSMTYRSSSSSNISNDLFSNVDDLSSVKVTSNSIKNHSTSDKDDLTVHNISLRMKKSLSDFSKSD